MNFIRGEIVSSFVLQSLKKILQEYTMKQKIYNKTSEILFSNSRFKIQTVGFESVIHWA